MSLRDIDPEPDVVLMVEATDECTYVRHHVKKIAYLLSAMQHFAEALRAKGIPGRLPALNRRRKHRKLPRRTCSRRSTSSVEVGGGHRAGRVACCEDMLGWEAEIGIPVEIRGARQRRGTSTTARSQPSPTAAGPVASTTVAQVRSTSPSGQGRERPRRPLSRATDHAVGSRKTSLLIQAAEGISLARTTPTVMICSALIQTLRR